MVAIVRIGVAKTAEWIELDVNRASDLRKIHDGLVANRGGIRNQRCGSFSQIVSAHAQDLILRSIRDLSDSLTKLGKVELEF